MVYDLNRLKHVDGDQRPPLPELIAAIEDNANVWVLLSPEDQRAYFFDALATLNFAFDVVSVIAEALDAPEPRGPEEITTAAINAGQRLRKVRALLEHAKQVSPSDRMNVGVGDLEEALS